MNRQLAYSVVITILYVVVIILELKTAPERRLDWPLFLPPFVLVALWWMDRRRGR